jgi:hypothetical protein
MYYPGIWLEGLRKTTKYLSISGLRSVIWTRDVHYELFWLCLKKKEKYFLYIPMWGNINEHSDFVSVAPLEVTYSLYSLFLMLDGLYTYRTFAIWFWTDVDFCGNQTVVISCELWQVSCFNSPWRFVELIMFAYRRTIFSLHTDDCQPTLKIKSERSDCLHISQPYDQVAFSHSLQQHRELVHLLRIICCTVVCLNAARRTLAAYGMWSLALTTLFSLNTFENTLFIFVCWFLLT